DGVRVVRRVRCSASAARVRLGVPVASFCFCSGPASTALYTLSLHDALPILRDAAGAVAEPGEVHDHVEGRGYLLSDGPHRQVERSEEHTSELQSRENLVCRLLLEKKNGLGGDK